MATRPAWGGTIPLVQIGSFAGFLKNRRSGKEIKQWFIVSAVSPSVVKTALSTTVGRKFVNVLQVHIMARLGFKPSPNAIGIELMAYIAFMKFQHITAGKAASASRQRSIERIMRPGKLTRQPGGRKLPPFPLGYFETLTQTSQVKQLTSPRNRGEEDERNEDESFITWFERRRRRKGKFVNV